MNAAVVVGARPNFMKAAPLLPALRERGAHTMLVHTGQHYDAAMSDRFFAELDLPAPDVNLGVGSGPNAEQIGLTMQRLAPVLRGMVVDVVVVVGDVNATVATALVAADLGVPVAHVEAGLRSFDRTMPEEVNRVVTDALATVHFTTSPEAGDNLRREGVDPARIHFVGNIMIDTLAAHLEAARAQQTARQLGLAPRQYALATIHRPANVDSEATLERLIDILAALQQRVPVVVPLHPRTARRLADTGLDARLAALSAVRVLPPLGYREFLSLEDAAALVLTDSGGVQEETTYLGVPCLTLRANTERPVTVTEGTNRVVGTDPPAVIAAAFSALDAGASCRRIPALWDGRTAARIVDVLVAEFGGKTLPASASRPV